MQQRRVLLVIPVSVTSNERSDRSAVLFLPYLVSRSTYSILRLGSRKGMWPALVQMLPKTEIDQIEACAYCILARQHRCKYCLEYCTSFPIAIIRRECDETAPFTPGRTAPHLPRPSDCKLIACALYASDSTAHRAGCRFPAARIHVERTTTR